MNKMKKNFLMFAALVATTVSFTACSSEDDLFNAEQGQEQERGVVKTEFTISIPQGTAGLTRMTTATVQGQETGGVQNPIFRGIQDIYLYPLGESADYLKNSTNAGKTNLPKAITLFKGTASTPWYGPSSTTDNVLDANALKANSNSHLYKDVEVPLKTKSLMFYGEAIRDLNTNNFENGCIKKNLSTEGLKLTGIRFEPQSIYTSESSTTNGENIAAYMTAIAQAAGWRTTSDVALKTLYLNFISTRAGSWTNVKAIVQELYLNIYSRTTNGHKVDDPNSIFTEADAIESAILNTKIGGTTTTFVTSQNGSKLTFVENDEILPNYPIDDMGLPDGAAQLYWNDTAEEPEDYKFDVLTATNNTGLSVAKLTNYAYPAPLYYQVLSDIRVSENSKYQAYSTASNWDGVLAAYEQVPNSDPVEYYREVTEKTRSIAVDSKVQYAVGRMDVTIQAVSLSLKDVNNTSVQVGTNNFKLTGVFVDGQKAVDYQFHQVGTDGYTIYDKNINGDIYLTSATPTQKNHTLVLETAEDQVVNIAIELENKTDKKIIGKNGCIIHPNCKFYLTGVLNTSGKTYKKVFMQDYYTVVNLTISSFQNAYNILPDLRAPELEMGVSVDLTWIKGNEYNINVE